MGAFSLARIAAGAGTLIAGLVGAAWAGAPLAATLVAIICGGLAFAILRPPANGRLAPERPIETTGLPPLPDASEMLESIDEPMLIVRNRRVLLSNAAARAVLGDHIDGVDVRLAIRHPAAAERLIDRGPGEMTERVTRTELVGLGERDRHWEMTTSLLRDGSRLVRLSDRSEALASEQMRVDFVANASHELRTPLSTLLGFLETLSEDAEAASNERTRSRFFTIMFNEAKRMQQLVDDLISLSRIESERFSVPRASVDLIPLLEDVRTACHQLSEEKQSGIVVDNRVGDAVVLGDQSQLRQMLQNLVVNALKYGKAGSDVVVRLDSAGPDMLRMSVIDRGEGIAQEHLPRLTERFYRVDPSRSRAIGGTGLGLAIVKHIVGRHRGRLDIRSALGQGTSVRVYLPSASGPLSSKSHDNVTGLTRNRPSDSANAE